MIETLPIVQFVNAAMIPIIALIAACVAFANYRLAKTKREDDLFDRRYNLFRDAIAVSRDTKNEEPETKIDFSDILARSGFLFDNKFTGSLGDLLLAYPENEDETVEVESEISALFLSRMNKSHYAELAAARRKRQASYKLRNEK